MDPIPVIYFIHQLGYGGAQRVIVHTAERLDRSRYQPMVVILGGRTDIQEDFEKKEIPVINLQSRAKFDPMALFRFYKFLRIQNPCILHTHLAYTGAIGRILGRLVGIPIIISTEQSHPSALHPLSRLIDLMTFRLADVLTAISLGIEEAYWGSSSVFSDTSLSLGKNRFTIHSGIDFKRLQLAQEDSNQNSIREEFQLEPSDIILGCVGRLHVVKGHKYLLDGMEELVEQFPNLKLLIIGDGDLRDELKSQVLDNCLENHVIFTGYREDIPSMFSVMDIVVLPSNFEAFGIAIAEAMALGRPVISTNTSGGKELIVHGETGLIVPKKNTLGLVEAITRLINHPEERTEMGKKGFERVKEHFSAEKMASQYALLYDQLVERKWQS